MTAKKKQESRKSRIPARPIKREEEVAGNPDPRIDEDFKGFPHAPAMEEIIRPEKPTEHLTAGTQPADKKNEPDEQASDGSARAFEKTERQPTETKKRRGENNY